MVGHYRELLDARISGNIVLELTKIFLRDIYHKVYCDNWFSSIPLLAALDKMGIQTLATVRPKL
jgi:hypothetical protein